MTKVWWKYDVTCNAIAPGLFSKELTQAVFSNPEMENEPQAKQPLEEMTFEKAPGPQTQNREALIAIESAANPRESVDQAFMRIWVMTLGCSRCLPGVFARKMLGPQSYPEHIIHAILVSKSAFP
ncbi:MAG: hypothetical protein GKR95_07270 [Gammaproteobacteria bacterium]|nr:hypothetical protein [Gammaproteobacteria bacterium]